MEEPPPLTDVIQPIDLVRATWLCRKCCVFNKVMNTGCEGCASYRVETAAPNWKVGDSVRSRYGAGVIKSIRPATEEAPEIFEVALSWTMTRPRPRPVKAYIRRKDIEIPENCKRPPDETVLRFFLPFKQGSEGLADFLDVLPSLVKNDCSIETVYLRHQVCGKNICFSEHIRLHTWSICFIGPAR